MPVSERDYLAEARAIHRRHPTVDLHTDPLLWSRLAGYDLLLAHRNRLPRSPFWSHSDVPRWREAGVKLALLGVVTFPSWRASRGPWHQARVTIDKALDAERRAAGAFRLVRGAPDLEAILASDSVGGLLSIEGAHAVEGSLEKLDALVAGGLRAVGLAHFHRNEAVAPSYGPGGDCGPLAKPDKAGRGLTDFGRELVGRVNTGHLLLDLAHTSRAGMLEAARLSTAPVFVSHTGIRRVHDHWRNLDDEQLRVIAATGGIVGVIFAGAFLGSSRLEAVVAHLEAVIDVIGEDHAAIGSDFDGMIVPVRGLGDVTCLPRLSAALLARGHGEERIAKILGGNALRFIRHVTGW